MAYEISVIGTGYVGLVTGTCFAATGNNVWCVDIDAEKVEKMKQGICPIFEPGLDYLLKQNISEGRLNFTTDLESAILKTSIVFLSLPTPPNEDGSADLAHVKNVARDIAELLKKHNLQNTPKIVINKSTVPVGTSVIVKNIFNEVMPENKVEVASNPEFLREGFAVEDALKPERVVIGTSSKFVEDTLRDLYKPFVRSGNPIYVMDEKSAEVTKYAANAFLATKISFMNDLSEYCEKVGADIENIRLGIGSDSRIGKRFLFAGIGYGGSCFPKDVRALIYSAKEQGVGLEIVESAHDVNSMQANRFFDKIHNRYEGNLAGKKFAVWGLAFKPNTDDTREAPAFSLIESLLDSGAKINVYDPEASENARRKFGSKIEYAWNMYECLRECDALIIVTEWSMFRTPDFNKIRELMKHQVIFDGRNVYQLSEMESEKFEYHSIGRRIIK